jgi:hypothetical protein
VGEQPNPLAETIAESLPRRVGSETPAAIGRYRIDRVLGQGGMGRVFKAYDPDLDRHVALKVLLGEPSSEAHARLLREARAMARLDHPNVVTVHEVGTAGEVDYIAMELVDGTTVDAWMRDPSVTRAEKLAAFLDAGSALAAAHEAGLVHRDFKPQNMLRYAKSGRIVVTDFGLARGETRSGAPNTQRTGAPDPATDSLSSTLTDAGVMLGTPAYMAPEQYRDSAVGPAADQFAFCVALWEALAGTRPYAGSTLEQLRAAIDRGPDLATLGRIPRRLRKLLRRGLSVDPGARYPSMHALLAALRPRIPRIAIAGAVVVVVAATIAVWTFTRAEQAGLPGCGDADDELAAFAGHPFRALVARKTGGREMLASLDGFATTWRTEQRAACAAAEPAERTRRVACLRVVRDELELALEVAAQLPDDLRETEPLWLVGDPLGCRVASRVAIGRDARSLAIARFHLEDLPAPSWPAESASDPACMRASWLLARSMQQGFEGDRQAESRTALEQAERCGDDRLRAMIAVVIAEQISFDPFASPGALRRAAIAVERVGADRYLDGRLRLPRAWTLFGEGDVDGAIAAAASAFEVFAAAGAHNFMIAAAMTSADLLRRRAAPGDNANAERLLRAVVAYAGPSQQRDVSWRLALALWHQGKVEDAHRVARELDPAAHPEGITVRGRVVDRDGKPVANARVVSAGSLVGDARSISIAPDRHTTTDATGAFALTGVGDHRRNRALVAAEYGELRSKPEHPTTAPIELRLQPTGSISGRVVGVPDLRLLRVKAGPAELGGVPWSVLASVAADGTFRIDGVPHGPAFVSASWEPIELYVKHSVVVGETPVGPVELVAKPSVPVAVIVRPEFEGLFHGAATWTVQGRVSPKTLGELVKIPTTIVQLWARVPHDKAPPALVGVVKPRDLIANARGMTAGEVTACAIAVGDLGDEAYVKRLFHDVSKLELRCVTETIAAPSGTIIVTVPAMKLLP